MKFATISLDGTDTVAVATTDAEAVVSLPTLYAAAGLGDASARLRDLLAQGPTALAAIADALAAYPDIAAIPVADVTWRPPIPEPTKVLGVAMNNGRLNDTAHVPPAGPMFFVKPHNTLVAHGDAIEIYDDYGFTFPELELGVVIGKTARNIARTEALDHVAGYTVVNDVTSQGLKAGDSIATELTSEARALPGYEEYFTWRNPKGEEDNTVYLTYHARSKGSDTFGPMGPFVTTKDEVANPDDLTVRGYADGELFTEDTTARYSYTIEHIVWWASRNFTLNPGDIIMCGTAAKGTEKFPRAHHDIDVSQIAPTIDVDIEGLGRLTNTVTHLARADD